MKYLYLTIILLYLFISGFFFPVFQFQFRSLKTILDRKFVMAAEGGAKTQVKADIPAKTYIRIFGYTAPSSLVQAEGIRVFAQTSSDRTGYFQINELPISFEAKELCLTTIDAQRRTGFPLCINLPDTNEPIEIGPLLLSPTLSLSAPLIWQNQTAYLSGQTVPESQVQISFFEVPSGSLALVRKAYAADLPQLSLSSDEKGNYSVNLPSSKAVGFRVFTKAFFKESPTPKSQTLTFSITAYTRYFYRYILPWILLLLMLALTSYVITVYEIKTKKGRRLLIRFNEKRLKPFAVRTLLLWRRLLYNLQDYLRSHRK